MKALIGEFIGTLFLVLLGDGVCCNISLNKSGMKAITRFDAKHEQRK